MARNPHRPLALSSRLLLVATTTLAALVAACSEAEPPPEAATEGEVLARERAAAFFNDTDYPAAREAILPLVEREGPEPDDLIRMANIEFAGDAYDAARPYVQLALQLAPDDPAVHWSLYRLARYDGDFEAAVRHVRRAHELAPDDFPTRLALANGLSELDRVDEAEAHYKELLALGAEFGASWLKSTLYRFHKMLLPFEDRQDESMRYLAEFTRLDEADVATPSSTELDRGTFGVVEPPGGGEVQLEDAEAWAEALGTGEVTTEIVAGPTLDMQGIVGIAPYEPVQPGAEIKPRVRRLDRWAQGVLLWGDFGVRLAELSGDKWSTRDVHGEAATLARGLDLGNDGDTDFIVATKEGLIVLEQTDGRWTKWPRPLLAGFVPSDVAPVDFDHDGDLDLLAVGAGGVRLLRNDAAVEEQGSFADATREAGLPVDTGFAWCAIEDLDVDNDVDFVLGGGDGGLFQASNERGGRFSDATAGFPEEARAAERELVFFDFFPDEWPDIALPGPTTKFFAGGPLGRFTPRTGGAGPGEGEALANGCIVVEDTRGDGRVRLVWPAGADGVRALDPRHPAREIEEVVPTGGRTSSLLVSVDLDGDGWPDWVDADDEGLRASFTRSSSKTIRLVLHGVKDNRDGVGAIVEVRCGPLYRRFYSEGEPLTVAVGTRRSVDVVRVTWPNGVVQNELDLASGLVYELEQKEGLVGSCPFLYAWNGETYEYISDVLGITPLGLPMAPGSLVPPDHDEYVLVRGDQLVPRDGVYELQFTEELREVTYLDRVRLEVVDHPEGTEIYPNEAFQFPPFPEHHVHTLRGPLAPRRVTGSDRRDWTIELGAIDDSFAVPFEPYRGQYLGLTDPHFLELEFDKDVVREAKKLRLFLTGWLYWTDASVNVAAARHPTIAFVPPILQVPDGDGWKDTGPPIGFPAGKLKTMVVDVTDVLDPEDPRLRLFSTLRLYWDAIRLGVDDDDAELRVTSLEPQSAKLWMRGFSEPIPLHGAHALDWFEWDRLAERPRWNQHPGLYTRLGEVLPLLTAIDDRFVIMGSGDALTVRFDATAAPPLAEGWTRDYLVFLDGWAKDRDPNTEEALYVEPLPFHAMSRYPYPESERFPDTEEHRTWRAEWNTRPSHKWIESLVPE